MLKKFSIAILALILTGCGLVKVDDQPVENTGFENTVSDPATPKPASRNDKAPDMVGKPINESTKELQELGFTVDVYDTEQKITLTPDSDWIVTEQNESRGHVLLGATESAELGYDPYTDSLG